MRMGRESLRWMPSRVSATLLSLAGHG